MHRLLGKMRDGSPAKIEFEDKGTSTPLYRDGLPTEAATGRFVINGVEHLNQVAVMEIEKSGQSAAAFRTQKDVEFLGALEVDVSSLCWADDGRAVF